MVGLRGLELQARSSIEPVSVTAPMLQARAHRAGAKVASDAANQTNTAGVVPSALILRSNITEPRTTLSRKGSFRAPRALRVPAPPARSPWRGFGGAAAPANRTASQLRRGDMVAIYWVSETSDWSNIYLTQSQDVIGVPEEIRTMSPGFRSLVLASPGRQLYANYRD